MTTTPTGELTVEEALRQLREMFPEKVVDAIHQHGGFWTLAQETPTLYDYWRVNVYARMEERDKPALQFEAPTLADCMAQVRDWKAKEGA